MRVAMRHCIPAFALALFVSAAAVADDASTFLDDWLQAENPMHIGCATLINKKTHEKIELVALNRTADPAVRGYRNKKTGQIIYSAIRAGNGEMLALKGLDGKLVSVVAADYEDFPANEVSDVTGDLKYIILDDYDEDTAKVDLKDAIAFIPVTGPILSRPALRNFRDGIAYLVKARPACVVVIVDSPGGSIAQAQDMCNSIQTLRRHSIKCVSYVNGENKYAMSAAGMICLSCEGIVMSPRSKMGAAIPINADMTNIRSDIHDKVVAGFAATLRALATGSNFPPELAEAMADKTLGAVALTVSGQTDVMSVKDAGEAKKKYAASKTPFAERVLCPAGLPAVVTAEEAEEIHAIAGPAESPKELAALVAPQCKHFAIYEPMDRYALRAKPVMDQMREFQAKFEAVIVRARAGGAPPQVCADAVAVLDKILDLQKRNPDFFDPDDSREVTDLRERIVGALRGMRGM